MQNAPRGTHILVCMSEKNIPFLERKLQLYTMELITIDKLEKKSPDGTYLICANDEQLGLK